MSKSFVAALVAASAIAAAFVWSRPSDDPRVVATPAPAVEQRVVAPPPVSAADAPAVATRPAEPSIAVPVVAPTVRAVRPSEFGRKLLEAKDLKSFVIEALKHPERGGAYYAALALNQCSPQGFAHMQAMADRTIQKVVVAESTISQERMDAINSALVRCVGFSDGERQALYAEASRHGVDGSDPLFALSAKLRGGASDRDKVFQSILESGSWALISRTSVPTRLIQATSHAGPAGTAYRFNGNTYTGAESRALIVGSRLGTCIDGDYCDLDEQMRTECRATGTCYASREDYVRQRWFNGDHAAYDKAAKIGDEIRSAIARGDRSVFR